MAYAGQTLDSALNRRADVRIKTLQFSGLIAAGARNRLAKALKPAPIVYLYEQTTWTGSVILLRVWPFDIVRRRLA